MSERMSMNGEEGSVYVFVPMNNKYKEHVIYENPISGGFQASTRSL